MAKAPFVGVKEYDNTADGLAAMIADGFTVGSAAYVIAQTFAAQNPSCATLKVAARAVQNAQAYTVTPEVLTAAEPYTLTIVGTDGKAHDYSFTSDSSPTAPEIVVGILADITADPATGVTATPVGELGAETHFTLTPTVAGSRFYLRSVHRNLAVKDTSADAGIATDLATAIAIDSDFYGVVIDSTSEPEINAAAVWCEANKRMFLPTSLDSDIFGSGSTDVASDCKAAGYNYTGVWAGRDGYMREGDGILARQFALDPGASVFHAQGLSSVIVDDLNPTEIGNAQDKNANIYVPMSGISLTLGGMAASGRFLDITRDTDWLSATMQADVLTVIRNAEKVWYTELGISMIENAMRSRLKIAQDLGMLAAGWTVTPPVLSTIPQADKAARILRNFRFAATLAGAIQGVEIRGTLTV
jgi:hypothetical protein